MLNSGTIQASPFTSGTLPTLPTQKCNGPDVQEAHIDFLLEEEFSVDPQFLRNFIQAAGQQWIPRKLESIRHSVSDQYGEADLIVIFTDDTSQRIALLIKDKILAAFQPRQAERYHERGVYGVIAGEWDQYWTALVAPASYIKEDHGFDAAVTLEDVGARLTSADPQRRELKAQVVAEAITKTAETGASLSVEGREVARKGAISWVGSPGGPLPCPSARPATALLS